MQLNTIQKYYSLDELALMLGCSKNTLRYNPKFPKVILAKILDSTHLYDFVV